MTDEELTNLPDAEEPYTPIGPDPLKAGKSEMWFALYDPETGEVTGMGNAYGQEEYDREVGNATQPAVRISGMLSSMRDYWVNLATLELELIPEVYVGGFTERDIDKERDRRIGEGFLFNGVVYQARDQDIRNINGAATAAAIAVMQQVAPGNLRWANPSKDFEWIAYDNSIVPMDAYTTIAFGMTAMGWVSSLTMIARELKNRLINGEVFDIDDDSLWAIL